MSSLAKNSSAERTKELMLMQRHSQCVRTDKMFGLLMIFQWVAAVSAAVLVTPQTWIGETQTSFAHVLVAVIWGAAISLVPVMLTVRSPGRPMTRHVVAASQMLFSAFLIHLTGGRTATHFHLFGSLAFLAFYRDWKVLITATSVVVADQLIRGQLFPLSIFGTVEVSSYRWIEHTAWILFIDFFLLASCRRETRETWALCKHQAELEIATEQTEQQVIDRTIELQNKTEEAEQLAMVAQYTDNAVVITNASAEIQWVNEGFVRCTGYTLEEVKGKVPGHLLQGEKTNPETVTQMRECLRDGRGFEVEVINYGKSKKPYWVSIECRPIHDEFGNVSRFIAIESDITARKNHEQQLRLYGKAVSEANDAIIISEAEPIDEPGPRILSVNAAFEKMTGYSSEDVLGKNPRMLQGPDSDPETRRRIKESLTRWKPVCEEILNYRKDGTSFWVELNIAPLADDTGRFTHWVSVQRNITERKEQEAEKARLSDKLATMARQAGMAEVATGVLHNVGNVLNSVNVTTQLLLDRCNNSPSESLNRASKLVSDHADNLVAFVSEHPGGKHLPEFLSQLSDKLTQNEVGIREELQILGRHVDHIKQIVKTQQSMAKSKPMNSEVDLRELVEDAILTLRDSFSNHAIIILRNLASLPTIVSDKHQILQILCNLLKNAKQSIVANPHSDRRLTITLEATKADTVFIEVTDSGVGIEPDNLAKVFVHGFTTKDDGHGFGLHSCANAAKVMGGAVTVRSDGIGKGATFRLTLPTRPATSSGSHDRDSIHQDNDQQLSVTETTEGGCV